MLPLKIGQKIKLTGTMVRVPDGERILARVRFDGALADVILDDSDLSHAEIIEKPVKMSKEANEKIKQIFRKERGNYFQVGMELPQSTFEQALDSMTEE